MHPYVVERWTDQEADVLRRYFTNLDGPVFALTNLPEVVKGALFARYSRTPKSLRRLFLDEFVGDLDITGDQTVDATVGLERAEQLYQKVFLEYGDDSVAQLGGVHLACEQASQLLAKAIEWGRLAAYLEHPVARAALGLFGVLLLNCLHGEVTAYARAEACFARAIAGAPGPRPSPAQAPAGRRTHPGGSRRDPPRPPDPRSPGRPRGSRTPTT